jgi:predicted component of type VI protein secretion system
VKLPVQPLLAALSDGPNIPLDKPIVLIGRHQECDIQIPSRKISRRHCCVALVHDHLVVRDLGSTNGIRINGIKVVEGNLQANDELMIGNIRYQVKWTDGEAAPAKTNGAKSAPPKEMSRPHVESREEPMPLPDLALSHPVLQSQPATGAAHEPIGLDVPDEVNLVPLKPPSKH